jgi:hypothetical protein
MDATQPIWIGPQGLREGGKAACAALPPRAERRVSTKAVTPEKVAVIFSPGGVACGRDRPCRYASLAVAWPGEKITAIALHVLFTDKL